MADFACEILTPYRRFYSGKAESVSFVTFDGQIEILADHDSLVGPVRVGQLRLVADGQARRAAITEGFARVKGGKVDIFVDAAEWPEEIDLGRAEQALERAVTRLSSEAYHWRIAASKMAAARARNRIAVAKGEASPTPPPV